MEGFFKGIPVLITGGLGFLGSNLAHRLVSLGAEVTLVDNFQPGHGGDWLNIKGVEDLVRVNISDIRDAEAMKVLVRGQTVIFHIAGQTSHVDSMTNPLLDADINCRGNLIFLEAIRENNPKAHVIYCSTRAVYGAPAESPAHEDILVRPVDIYGVNKWAGEAYHLLYHKRHGIPVTILRVSNTYGPRAQIKAPSFGILNWMLGQAMQGKTLKIFGDGQQLRDYTYINDALEAFLLTAATGTTAGQVYNVSSEMPVTFKTMVETVIKVAREEMGVDGGYEHVAWPGDRKAIEVGDFQASAQKIRDALGWAPATALEDGLRETLRFYKPLLADYLR